jgi:RNA polymerase sigma-B factor
VIPVTNREQIREGLIEAHLPLVRAVARRYAGLGEELDDLVQVGAVGLVKAAERFDPSRGVAFATFAAPAIEGEVRRHLRKRTRSLRIPQELHQMEAELHRSNGDLSAALGSDNRLLLARGLRALDQRERRIVFLRFNADMTERQIAQAVGISQAHVSRLLDGALATLRNELGTRAGAGAAADITPGTAISPPARPPARLNEKMFASEPANLTSAAGTPVETRIKQVGADQQEGQRLNPTRRQATSSKMPSTHSGRFLVRMPSELHEQLARAAERDEVSLNRFVTDVLASSVSSAADEPTEASETRAAAGNVPRRARALRVTIAANLVVVVVAGVAAVVLLTLALERGI